jgi:fructuronate reductase
MNRLPHSVEVPAYDRDRIGIGVVHFGPGAFFRAHTAWYFDTLLQQDDRWGICAVSLRSGSLAHALSAQDGLYAHAVIDEPAHFRVIGSIKENVVAAGDPARVFARLAEHEVRLVTLTVTEKAYCLDARGALDLQHTDVRHDISNPARPRSLVGWLVEGLMHRHAAGHQPFTVMSCDNLVGNGKKLRAAVLAFARMRGAHDLAAWIHDKGSFPGTMVDSITPATDEALKQRVTEAIGLVDEAPVQRESYAQWVIEDCLGAGMPDLASVGATSTRDVGAAELAKLRLLNGAHSALAYLGLLAGHQTVHAAMSAGLARFVEAMMRRETAPTLRSDSDGYITAILERLRNPALQHQLVKIAADGSQKLPYRFLAPISDALAAGGRFDRLCLAVAAWMRFIAREARAGRAIDDPMSVRLAAIGRACNGVAQQDVPRFLAIEEIFGGSATSTQLCAPLIAAYGRLADGLASLG